MVPENKKPIRNYSIFLIKKDRISVSQIINLKNIEGEEKITNGRELIGTLYLKKADYRRPRWASIFDKYIDTRKIGEGGNPSALLLIKVKDRFFAITFGQGRYLLVQDCWEERFGLKSALNIIEENSIKSLDKKTFDSISIIAREQASKEIRAEEFGLDIEKDLLSAVVGFPKDKSYGERASGMDSFKVAIRSELEDIGLICGKIYDKFNDKSYKERYPWVDHLSEVKDKGTIEKLDNELSKYLNNQNFEKCWSSVPEIISWDTIEGFKYGLGARSPIHYDIHLPEFLHERLADEEITSDHLKNRFVYGVTEEHIERYRWPIYKCIYCEVVIPEIGTFLLNGGKWYHVDDDFIKSINSFYDAIKKCNLAFPEYNHNSEKDYNIAVHKYSNNFALMDREIIKKIEFCDLYEKNGYIIHVKRYGASSVLSHLFMQGINSAELFQTDVDFRRAVNERLPNTHKFPNVEERPPNYKYEIVYAIVSDFDGDKIELPLFSKLTLRNAVKRLNGLGFHVSLKKINVNKSKRLLKKLPPVKNY